MRLLLAALAVLLAVSSAVHAQDDAAGNPYEGRAVVGDQSAGARDRGLRDALAQVVARVSGPGVDASALLARAPQLVQRYGYASDDSGALQLVASFDKNAVDSQLRALGLPVWGYSSAPLEDVQVSISGLRNSSDYAAAINAIRAVPGVKNVAVQGAEGEHLQLFVRTEGGAARLGSALAGNRRLVSDSGAVTAPNAVALRLMP